MQNILRLDILARDEDFDRITGLLTLCVSFGWEEESLPTGETRFRVHCEQPDFMRDLQNRVTSIAPNAHCVLEVLEEQDWLAAWRQFFTPVCCGSRFVVLPPWLAQSPDFPDRAHLLIEPKSAFGTGHHATTALCLKVLSDLLDQRRLMPGQSFLDLGTGSGVLGIACCKSGLRGLGLDIDPLAVDNALENRALNDADGFEPSLGSMEAVVGRTFDLVVANILARPLIELAPAIAAACKPGGSLILSGLLEIQADGVEAAYHAQGLPLARRARQGEWCALVWQQAERQE